MNDIKSIEIPMPRYRPAEHYLADMPLVAVANLIPSDCYVSGSVTVQQQPQQHLLFSTAANSSNSNQSNQSAGNQHICNIQLPQRVTDFDAVSDQQLLQQQQQEQQQEIERLTQLTQLNQEQLVSCDWLIQLCLTRGVGGRT